MSGLKRTNPERGYGASAKGPLLGPRFRGSWPLEGLGRGEVRLGRRVEADDVVVVSLPCAPPNFNIKSEDAVLCPVAQRLRRSTKQRARRITAVRNYAVWSLSIFRALIVHSVSHSAVLAFCA